MRKLFPYNWKYSFWFWWLVLTGLYLGLSFGFGWIGSFPAVIGAAIGFFVPMGYWNFLGAFGLFTGGGMAFLTFPVLILGVIFFDKIAYHFRVAGKWKIILNLAGLLALTFIVDLLIWGHWATVEFFVENLSEYGYSSGGISGISIWSRFWIWLGSFF